MHFQRSVPSLSTYFPAGTQYFYGYPAGEESGFINYVPPEVEELVAARAFSCAGSSVSVIAFSSTGSIAIPSELLQTLGIPQLSPEHTITLPASIDYKLTGNARNDAVKKALQSCATPGKLMMAQPFMDDSLRRYYQLDPALTTWLNDKNHLGQYIESSMLPERLGVFPNGEEFAAHASSLSLPFVAKVTLSSSGDGVHICRTKSDVQTAVKRVKNLEATILVERFLQVKKNYCIHFGIPAHKSAGIDIIGINEQLTTSNGDFMGGIVHAGPLPDHLQSVITYMRNDVLPAIRKMGWYGVGAFDVLIDEHDQPYFIDCNFRVNGTSAYLFLLQANKITAPLVSFSGTFKGTQGEFEQVIVPMAAVSAPARKLQFISLSYHGDGIWRFNAALLLSKNVPAVEQIRSVLDAGIESAGLTQLAAAPPQDL